MLNDHGFRVAKVTLRLDFYNMAITNFPYGRGSLIHFAIAQACKVCSSKLCLEDGTKYVAFQVNDRAKDEYTAFLRCLSLCLEQNQDIKQLKLSNMDAFTHMAGWRRVFQAPKTLSHLAIDYSDDAIIHVSSLIGCLIQRFKVHPGNRLQMQKLKLSFKHDTVP